VRDLAWLTARPIAHRGLHDVARGIVENCPKAFLAAIAGNYAIECDVQPSSDGEAMVFHDFTLERLTTATGPVSGQTAADLRHVGFRQTTDRMLPLADLLALVDGRVGLVVEIKSRFDGDMTLTDRVVAVTKTYGGPLAVMSFDPAVIARVRQTAPDLPRGIVAETAYDDGYWKHLPAGIRDGLERFAHAPETDPHFLSWRVGDLPAPATVLFRGLLKRPVICWTVRNADDRARATAHADQVTFEGYAA
jgi:glycerophosphoryl diester phosphodiesterase